MSVSTDISSSTRTESVSLETEDATVSEEDVEYVTQYFGFLPQSFMNGSILTVLAFCPVSDVVKDFKELQENLPEPLRPMIEYVAQNLQVYNTMLEYLKEAMKTLNEAILNSYKDKVSETELKEVSSKQGQIAVQKLDKLFDKAESYLSHNVFSLPSNLVLPEDRPQVESPCSEEQMNDLDTRLKEVKDRIMAVRLANSVLRQRMSETDTLQKELNASLEYIQNWHKTVAEESAKLQKTADENNQVIKTVKEFETMIGTENL